MATLEFRGKMKLIIRQKEKPDSEVDIQGEEDVSLLRQLVEVNFWLKWELSIFLDRNRSSSRNANIKV